MARYVIVHTRDPSAHRDAQKAYDLAARLARQGEEVTLFLAQNGVFPAHHDVVPESLAELVRSGVTVVADEVSLRERGIAPDRLAAGVSPAPIDLLVDLLADSRQVFWH
jgi:sulfur relay (sulfurtransferase) complex TusBCD TusD component (DsrE family)